MIDTTSPPDTGDLLGIGRARFEPGYWCSMLQPAMVVQVLVLRSRVEVAVLRRFEEVRVALFPLSLESAGRLDPVLARHPLLAPVSLFVLDVLAEMGMPTMSAASLLPVRDDDGKAWLLGLPAFSVDVDAPQLALGLAVRVLNLLAASVPVNIERLRSRLQDAVQRCRAVAPRGMNTLRFLQAAHELGIPWRHVAHNVYQFGWGSRARWLDSSFTDETPNISARLARDKVACAKVLRAAGLPVPRHQLVTTLEQALAVASSLGYPVVVKPADQDGGRGVFAGLHTSAEVSTAYAAAARLSRRILVEQYIEGSDYRLQVYQGQVFWVVHRRAAYVVGDGVRTVSELIDRVNAERRHAKPDPVLEQGSKPILLDAEVQAWLSKQGLSMESRPASGQAVRLRGAANVSLGGTRQPVTDSSIHPDNLALAARAAVVMRLDLAGIDLLLPDISRSWRETGGAICEVNAQPQLAAHLPAQLLPRLVAAQGRIPVVMVVGAPVGWTRVDFVAKELQAQGFRLGSAVSAKACLGLLVDPSIDAVVWLASDIPKPAEAFPVDKVDLLVLINRSSSVLPSWAQRANMVWHIAGPSAPLSEELIAFDSLPDRLSSFFLESCMVQARSIR